MKPYYDRGGVTIYCGDCREILPQLGPVDLLFTDPPWPNLTGGMNTNTPYDLFSGMCNLALPVKATKAIVILGCDSDPHFINCVNLPYYNTCWIRRVPAFFKGAKFIGADMAYVFGEFKGPTGRGQRVFSQEFNMVSHRKRPDNHPAPRNQQVIDALISVYSYEGQTVLDPFLGSGTTAVACKRLNRNCVGIEISEQYCEMAVKRLSQEVFDLR